MEKVHLNSITAVIIAKNEQEVILECINSVKFCDEILVIDSGSNDQTVRLAKKLGARVIKYPLKDFARTRNYAKSIVSTRFILYVDADERVSEGLKSSILEVVNNNNPKSAYSVTRVNYYFGRKWPAVETIIRLFLKSKLRFWTGIVHESPSVEGQIEHLTGDLTHYTHRNIEKMIAKTIEWSSYEAKLRFANDHPPVTWWRLIRVFITATYNSYIRQKGFKAGTIGVIESIYQGFSMVITYIRLWEMQLKKTTK